MTDHQTSFNEHIQWTEEINGRLERIYKELCEYEGTLQDQSCEPIQLFEMLDTVNELHSAAKAIRLYEPQIDKRHDLLRNQMELLQKSVQLLKLEDQTKQVDIVED